jgi:hypothetical protein
MFCEACGMQLSAANLLIASQQIARGQQKVAPDARAQFTAALAKEKDVQPAAFEPMEFKQTAAAPAQAASAQPAAYNAAARVGSQIDIRV